MAVWPLYPFWVDEPLVQSTASKYRSKRRYIPSPEEQAALERLYPGAFDPWIRIQVDLLRQGIATETLRMLSAPAAISLLASPATTSLREVPVWNAERRELRFRGMLCRVYTQQGAENQTRILASFEELGWPASMDSPLGRDADLKQTLYRMNQSTKGIRFRGNGTGTQVSWEPVTEP